jgi:hypothetical protein
MKFRELLDRSCKMWIWVPGGRAYRVSDEVLDQTVEELTLKEWVSYGIEHGYAQRTGHLAYDRVTPVTTLEEEHALHDAGKLPYRFEKMTPEEVAEMEADDAP